MQTGPKATDRGLWLHLLVQDAQALALVPPEGELELKLEEPMRSPTSTSKTNHRSLWSTRKLLRLVVEGVAPVSTGAEALREEVREEWAGEVELVDVGVPKGIEGVAPVQQVEVDGRSGRRLVAIPSTYCLRPEMLTLAPAGQPLPRIIRTYSA